MGEELAGVDALRIAVARINAGQSEIGLVGASYNAQRKDLLLQLAFGREGLVAPYVPVWARGKDHAGIAVGSLGAFLVIESRAHAEARGARAYAKLARITADRSKRGPGELEADLSRMFGEIVPRLASGRVAVLSCASGASPATAIERAALAKLGKVPVRATGSVVGHGVEAQFPLNVALAALALKRGSLWPPLDPTGFEQPWSGPLTQVVVTGVSAWRGEGLGLIEAL
jgi:3-oxoacyl-[acyl-carrier-protein] synthase II